MIHDCIPVEEMGRIAGLSPEDPRRRHAETCPRCSALLATYAAFLRGENVPHADPDEAERRLREWAETSLLRGDRAAVSPVLRAGARASWLDALLRPRPAWAIASVAVVCVFAGIALWSLQENARTVLRQPTTHALQFEADAKIEGGQVRFSWSQVEDATSYEIHLYRTDLVEVGRLPAGAATTLVVTRDRLVHVAGSGVTLLWRVVALRDEDPVEESAPRAITVP